jgi:hypothetical protein
MVWQLQFVHHPSPQKHRMHARITFPSPVAAMGALFNESRVCPPRVKRRAEEGGKEESVRGIDRKRIEAAVPNYSCIDPVCQVTLGAASYISTLHVLATVPWYYCGEYNSSLLLTRVVNTDCSRATATSASLGTTPSGCILLDVAVLLHLD